MVSANNLTRRRLLQKAGQFTLAGGLTTLSVWANTGLAQETTPPFDLVDLAGRPIRLTDYAGSALYLDFWASWCGPCKQSFPWMNAMQATYGAQGLRILAINLDKNKASAERFLNETPASFQIAWDPEGRSARDYKVKAMPTSMVISCTGKSVIRHSGFSAGMKTALEADIKSSLCRA